MQSLAVVVAGLVGLAAADTAVAQKISDRTITIVVPFTAGTGVDLIARTLGQELQQRLGQPVIVENKPGASGNIGTQHVARAAADGHTLLFTANTFVMNVPLFKALPYDPQVSFAPIAEAARGAMVLVAHPSLGAATLADFASKAKAAPGKLDYASPGRGTPHHMAMELFKVTAGIDLLHVPYSGSAGAMKDLAGGHVGSMFLPLQVALPLARDGQVRILAIGSAARAQQAPDVPTFAEVGHPGFDVDLWYAMFAPKELPADLAARFNAMVNEILAVPAVREALARQGVTARGGTSAALAKLVADDLARWASVARKSGIVAE
jgi:tripartite-type tricarboxylate transporter receptor subunit TctC